jgi:type III secretion protein T
MIDSFPISALAERFYPLLAVWLIIAARFIGFAMVFPLFSWANLPPLVRAAFAAAMAAPIAMQEFAQPGFVKALQPLDILALTSKELFVGLIIGLMAGLPFWAAQNCGELIDTYRGSSAGALFDPSVTSETTALGSALIITAIALLVWSGGAFEIVRNIYLSFQVWPPDLLLPPLRRESALIAGGIVGRQLLMGVGFSAAIVVTMFAVDLALALMGRSTRQVQVFDISQVLKNLALVLLLPLVGGALIATIGRQVSQGSFTIDWLRQMLPPLLP